MFTSVILVLNILTFNQIYYFLYKKLTQDVYLSFSLLHILYFGNLSQYKLITKNCKYICFVEKGRGHKVQEEIFQLKNLITNLSIFLIRRKYVNNTGF